MNGTASYLQYKPEQKLTVLIVVQDKWTASIKSVPYDVHGSVFENRHSVSVQQSNNSSFTPQAKMCLVLTRFLEITSGCNRQTLGLDTSHPVNQQSKHHNQRQELRVRHERDQPKTTGKTPQQVIGHHILTALRNMFAQASVLSSLFLVLRVRIFRIVRMRTYTVLCAGIMR